MPQRSRHLRGQKPGHHPNHPAEGLARAARAHWQSRVRDLHADPPSTWQEQTRKFRDPPDTSSPASGLLGLADDEGVRLNGGRIGAAHGPDAFRAALAGYGAADSVALEGFEIPIIDLGNIVAR